MWQDFVFAIGAVIFSVALLPAIRGQDKPPPMTSIPTAMVLYIFSFTYMTLHLWLASSMQFIAGSLWAVLAFQQYAKHKR